MPKNRIFQIALFLTLSLSGTLALGHHGMTTKFDPSSSQVLHGKVTRIDWANPHVHVFLAVGKGVEAQSWYVELASPQLLEFNGWRADTVKAGAAVTVRGFRARDGSRQVWGESVSLDASGRQVFALHYQSLAESITADTRPPPRWPDGQVRLGASPGDAGYWVPASTLLMEDGANVAMLPNGQLKNPDDAARVAPLQDWALALYRFRQGDFLRSDPTYLLCRPPAGPRKWFDPYGIQLLEDRPLQRIFVIPGGGNHDWHLIYTDGRALDSKAFQLDADNELYYGRNSAHWQGDTLVIESNGYNERFWLPGGLPHTNLMHVTERLTRETYGKMHYSVTIDDPGAYTRPWTASLSLLWLDGSDTAEHYCQDNRL